MNGSFLPFSKPSISESDIAAVTDVLRCGWITTGAACAQFEQQFKSFIGSQQAVALSSATAGMHLLLHALNIGPGDEVITPSMTWVSTINLISACGATPVFADIDRDTLMINAETVAPLITASTRLIIPVHFAGAAAELTELQELADAAQIPLIQDAAHAIGTQYRQQSIGKNGTAIFSFHPIKNITTGEGGMFCSDDVELAERIRRLRSHGLGMDAFDRQTHARTAQAEVLEPGYKYNLPDMNAALGITQLQRINSFNQRRAELAQLYLQQLAEIDEVMPLKVPSSTTRHAWHLFIIRLDIDAAKLSRNNFMQELKAKGIGTGLHFRAVHTQKYYREHYPNHEQLVNTIWNSERLCSLPLFPDMRDEDVTSVVNAIKSVLKH